MFMKKIKLNLKSILEFLTTSKNSKESDPKEPVSVDGQHSFLFWLVVPIILVWLSIGYVIGFAVKRGVNVN